MGDTTPDAESVRIAAVAEPRNAMIAAAILSRLLKTKSMGVPGTDIVSTPPAP